MPAVAKKSSKAGAHDAWPENDFITGEAATVFVNGEPVLLDGAKRAVHCDNSNPPKCHDGGAISGATVFVEGKPVLRIGDPIDCGGVVVEGSPDVSAG